MLEVYSTTKIYIACPAAVATGGPELLHQLCANLRGALGIAAYMYYYPPDVPDPVHPNYRCYGVPFSRTMDDESQNILVVPEIKSGMEILKTVKDIRKVVWFLSIDAYYISRLRRPDFFIQKLFNKCYRAIFGRNLFNLSEIKIDEHPVLLKRIQKDPLLKIADAILAQSYYALEFLKTQGYEPVYLSDYLNEDFLRAYHRVDLSKKENIVTYNPKKGFEFTSKLIKKSPNIRFVPIVNMSREEVIKTLQKAKVYIDFGNHPGKDRLPREAAILGCCVITGRRGSAAYFEDVPISEEYKFDDREENIPAIIAKIKDCLHNFEEHYKNFDHYREVIRQEPQKFIEDMKKIFVKV